MERIKIVNGRVLTPHRLLERGCIVIEGETIREVTEGKSDAAGCKVLDAEGCYVSPGFMDIHTHGGGGHDFMDGTVEAYLGAAQIHARHGTTSLVPTTLTAGNSELKNTFGVYEKAVEENKNGARFLGLHLEGPYFSMEMRGAQNSRYIRNPSPDEYMKILSWSDRIVRWSAAPELEGSLEFAFELRKRGILVSVAHSNAVYEQVLKAYERGFSHVTHLYSGMSSVRRINAFRYAGVVESAYLIDGMTVEIIADGKHLPASLLKLIYRIKGPDRIALISDSMRAAGMQEGESLIGSLKDGQKVLVEDGVAKLPDRTAFAGSVATADRLVRTMVELADVPLADAVRMITHTPAAIMGLDSRMGCLAPGRCADIAVFDDDFNVRVTLVGGRTVYRA